jgi:hypothetical protein
MMIDRQAATLLIAEVGEIFSVTGSEANVADIVQTDEWLDGEAQEAFADAGLRGVEKWAEMVGG